MASHGIRNGAGELVLETDDLDEFLAAWAHGKGGQDRGWEGIIDPDHARAHREHRATYEELLAKLGKDSITDRERRKLTAELEALEPPGPAPEPAAGGEHQGTMSAEEERARASELGVEDPAVAQTPAG